MYNGVLNIYKEAGFTSHDVVAKLRRILKQKKIGHTGTLDPDAVGVLPVCLGKATRLCDMLTEERKTYRAVMRLGVDTDTQDMSGKILAEKDVAVTEEQVRTCIEGFVGEQLQIPPMYSALKVDGKKLYELAREGKTVERKARPVTFYEIQICSMELPQVTMLVTCSKGTYIRTLCHDIGEQLGVGGAMEHLTRTRVGRFQVEEAYRLSELEELARAEKVESVLVSVEEMFDQLPKAHTQEIFDKIVYNGNALRIDQFQENELSTVEGDELRVYDSRQCFVGVFEYEERREIYKPRKMFLER
ncbi:MAG: tRNA pseudouridine(55) synthase TruB [Lachnospiraceae bacterium]|nr:tRNA pseudouridine(55) synthase TruB [Lachnospiraceae bacterium]